MTASPQLIASDTLCLAHTETKLEWCARRDTCKRHLDIRNIGGDGCYGVLFRVCQHGANDQYIEAKP